MGNFPKSQQLCGYLCRTDGKSPYYRSRVEGPGNPWFVTTLWYARYLIAVDKEIAELAPALELLEWTAAHALPSGVLAELLDPASGAPLSVSPLTWSHATLVTTVCAYREKEREFIPS